MVVRKGLGTALAGLLLLYGANASALVVVEIGSDGDYVNGFQPGYGFSKIFGGDVRWGDAAGNGDWELSLVGATLPPTYDQQQVAWNAGQTPENDHTVTFAYDPAGSASASLSITAKQGISWGNDTQVTSNHQGAEFPGPGVVNALLVRAKAGGDDLASLTDITVAWSGDSYTWTGALEGDLDAQYVAFIGSELASGFTVTADAVFQDGSGSLPQYGFKVGTVVPLPAGVWLLAAGLVGYLSIGAGRRSASRQAGTHPVRGRQ